MNDNPYQPPSESTPDDKPIVRSSLLTPDRIVFGFGGLSIVGAGMASTALNFNFLIGLVACIFGGALILLAVFQNDPK